MDATEGNGGAAWAIFPCVALISTLTSIPTRTDSYARRPSGQAAATVVFCTGVFRSVPMQVLFILCVGLSNGTARRKSSLTPSRLEG